MLVIHICCPYTAYYMLGGAAVLCQGGTVTCH